MNEVVSGWGLTPKVLTRRQAFNEVNIADLLREGSLICRGLGRAYGDCAVNGFGVTAITTELHAVSLEDSVLVAEAGASIDQVLRFIVPRGYFIPVTPGTKFVTIGGAIAADVHGKNHHKDGSFGNYVIEMDLLLANGETQTISPLVNSKLFWATVGGMGLTGVILRAKIQLKRIETSKVKSTNIICPNIDSLMEAMIKADEVNKYSVAWVDTLASGKRLGRSILSLGDHAAENDLSKRQKLKPLLYSSRQILSFPTIKTNSLLNRYTVRLFNVGWFQKARFSRKKKVVSFDKFFFPLDGVRNWNRMYGTYGFIQYQICVPDSASHLIKYVLEELSEKRIPSFLSVLKRFGPQSKGLLSFPSKGWTLAVDIPAGVDGVGELLDELDEKVVNAGGRLYFAKDSRMNPGYIERMYPKLEEFREVKREIDANSVFQSNMSRRLGL